MKQIKNIFFITLIASTAACSTQSQSDFSLPYQKYTLANGLEVVLHEDKSDPIVSVAIQYHVGSSREKVGKTGFAHFFEHMLFQRSENLPRNTFFRKIDELGGSFNGFTTQQGTCYFETVPRNALEKVLWMESDRMGFFINTVTEGGLKREIDIVSNEKRQGENRPYGHLYSLVLNNLYPKDHPYNWTVIGEIPDLRSATIEDVKEFYNSYYNPSNATLVVAGDFDETQVKELIEKYFGEIASGVKPEPLPVTPVTLQENKLIYYSDSYAPSPLLYLVYPTVEENNKDRYALDLMAKLIAGDKKSPLYKIAVQEKKLVADISMSNDSQEIAGFVSVGATTFPNVNLNDLNAAIKEAFERFELEGISDEDLDRYKANIETSTYRSIVSLDEKAIQMAINNVFGGKPDKIVDDLKGYNAVTKEDVMRVYNKYIKDANYLSLSVIPTGQEALAIEGAVAAVINQESIDEQELNSSGEIVDDPYQKSVSKFDRSIEPGLLANTPEITLPKIWSTTLSNGIEVKGIEYNELPLVNFSIILSEGMLKDSIDKVGVAYLTAQMMNEGTKNKSADELLSAIGKLGASIDISSSTSSMILSGSCLKDKLGEVITLASEMILEPRWDENDFEVVKNRTIDEIRYNNTNPGAIARSVFRKAIYGGDNIISSSPSGSEKSIASITLDDLKSYYNNYVAPSEVTKIDIVSSLSDKQVQALFEPLASKWTPRQIAKTVINTNRKEPKAKVLFIDYPESRQSNIVIGMPSIGAADNDAYALTIINEKMGGSTSSFLFDILRLKHGYTYGANSQFSQGRTGLFVATSSVQATVTKESLQLFKDILSTYSQNYTPEMHETVRNTLMRSGYGAYETPNALLGVLNRISLFDLPFDFVKQNEKVLREMTAEQATEYIKKYMNFDDMIVVVVGDVKTQLANVKAAGLGEVIVVDKEGN